MRVERHEDPARRPVAGTDDAIWRLVRRIVGRLFVRRGGVLSVIPSARSTKLRVFGAPVLAVAAASLLFAACSSSSKSTTSAATNPPATTASGSGAVTVSAANVPGVGTVLVDGNNRTLYVLVGEKGGKVTCTSSGNCTGIWPPMVLPAGTNQATPGSGVQASLLGVVMGPSGDHRVTYNGWPLYTFSGDTAPGQAKGQGVKDVYGLWWVLSPSGDPITTGSSSSGSSGGSSGGPSSSTGSSTPASTSPPTTSGSSGASSGGAGF